MKRIIVAILFILMCAINAHAATVNVAWDASTSTDVVGYKFYLRNVATPATVQLIGNVGKVTSTSLTIPDITGADAFHLVATAFDAAGNESAYSDPAVKVSDGSVAIFKDNVAPNKPTNLRIP